MALSSWPLGVLSLARKPPIPFTISVDQIGGRHGGVARRAPLPEKERTLGEQPQLPVVILPYDLRHQPTVVLAEGP